MVIGDVQLHGGTQKPLQKRIVQFLRDACALRQSFFKAHIHLPLQCQHSQSKKHEYGEANYENAGKPKPPCLPVSRLDDEWNGGLGAVPQAIAVTGNKPEAVLARPEIIERNLACAYRLAPGVVLAFEF